MPGRFARPATVAVFLLLLQTPAQAGAVTLVQTEGAARLRFADGKTLALPLPPDAEVEALAGPETGWLAAGSVRSAEGGRELFLLRGDRGLAVALPVPPSQEHRIRRRPVLFTRGGRLTGLAWLEGDGLRSLAVRAASWKGNRGGFAAPVWVSRPGPGSQLALTGAALADGSWLLAWSAFDGEDDEVVWSRFRDGVWSAVRPVSDDNAVPDVTPHLAAAGNGALLAWSRYDAGDYRVRLTRFVRDGFVDEQRVGEPGSLHPRIAVDGERITLTYETVLPVGRGVAELDGRGRIVRRAVLPREALSQR